MTTLIGCYILKTFSTKDLSPKIEFMLASNSQIDKQIIELRSDQAVSEKGANKKHFLALMFLKR